MSGFWAEVNGERDSVKMTSVGVAPTSGLREASGHGAAGVDRLPEEMNDMKIRDDRVWIFALFLILALFQECLCGWFWIWG